MNRRQKSILINFITVIVITAAAVVAMVNFKDWVNRSEAMRAMEQLGQVVLWYRKDRGSVPPESYVNGIKENLQGYVRLGTLQYRAQWLDFDSSPDEILAYTEKKYRSVIGKGFIVLRLDGRVEWMEREPFKTLLAQQQSPEEIEILEE
jgi:type II secretory pathway pseudopilin PulG